MLVELKGSSATLGNRPRASATDPTVTSANFSSAVSEASPMTSRWGGAGLQWVGLGEMGGAV